MSFPPSYRSLEVRRFDFDLKHPHREYSQFSLGTLDFRQQLDEFLFAFGLILSGLGFGQLRDVHGAELWAAHGAELRFLVKVVR